MRQFWLTVGWISFAAGIAGLVLPMFPGAIFMIFAAYAFGKSSPRLKNLILTNRHIGPPVVDWRDHGIIRRKAKFGAFFGLGLSIAAALLIGAPAPVLTILAVILAVIAVFIWSRPETPVD